MNAQSALLRHCLNAYRLAERMVPAHRGVGLDIAWEDSPTRLAAMLRARLLSPRTLGVNWLALAIAVLEARANA